MSAIALRRRGAHRTGATVLASDQFSGGNTADIAGRTTDSGLGGTGKTWAKGAGTRLVGIASGQAVQGTGSTINTYAIDASSGDVFVYTSVVTGPTGTATLSLLARQDSALGTITFYRALITGTSNSLQLQSVVAGSVSSLGAAQTWANGDVIGVRCSGSTIEMWKNGAAIVSVTDTAIANTNTKVGIRPSAAAVFSIDDFVVQAA